MRDFLQAVGLLVIFSWHCTPALASMSIGLPAPALSVPELGGQPFALNKLRGRVVIVNFWATWCPPCREEMPALNAFYRRYHDRGVVMIGLSMDRARDRDAVLKIMRTFSYPGAMLDDAKNNDFEDPDILPVTYVIDGKGLLRFKLTPDTTPVTEKSLSDIVLPLLSK